MRQKKYRKQKNWAIVLSIIIPILLYFNIKFVYSDYCVLPALFSLPVVLYVFFVLIFSKNSNHLFIFPSIALTWVYFLMPYLLKEKVTHLYRVIPENYLPTMAIFCCFAIYFLYAGFYLSFKRGNVKPLSPVSYKASNEQLTFLIKLFIGLGLFFRIGNSLFPQFLDLLGSIIQILFYAPTIACALLVMYFIRKGPSVFLKLFSILYLLIEFFYRIAETLYFHVILLLVGGVIIYFLEQKRLPYKFVILFLLLTIPLYLTRFDHRYGQVLDRWYNGNKSTFLEISSEGIGLFTETLSTFDYSNFDMDSDKYGTENKSSRFENVSYLAHCVYKHKEGGMSFKYGQTFYWLPIAPIPRILIPFKPVNVLSTKIAEDYGLKGNSKGSMNFPILCESYINFGFYGILIIAFFQGMFFKWSFYKVGGIKGDLNILIFLNILKQLGTVEANITLVFGAILQVFVFWYLLLKYVLPKQNIQE